MNSLERLSSSDLFLRSTIRMRTNENVNRSNLVSANGPQEEKLVQMALSILKDGSRKQSVVKTKLNIFDQVETKRRNQIIQYNELVKNKERTYIRIICDLYNNNLAGQLSLLKSILLSRLPAGDAIKRFQKHFKVDDKTESAVKHFLNLKTLVAIAEKQLAQKPKIAVKVISNGSLMNKRIAFKKSMH